MVTRVSLRRRILLIVQSLIGLGLLAAWAQAVDVAEVARRLGEARWPLILLGAARGLPALVLRSLRWRIVLLPLARVSVLE